MAHWKTATGQCKAPASRWEPQPYLFSEVLGVDWGNARARVRSQSAQWGENSWSGSIQGNTWDCNSFWHHRCGWPIRAEDTPPSAREKLDIQNGDLWKRNSWQCSVAEKQSCEISFFLFVAFQSLHWSFLMISFSCIVFLNSCSKTKSIVVWF